MSYQRIFVDGHSVIYAWDGLRALHQRAPQQAQSRLVNLLTGFQDASHLPVTLVFDGGKRSKAFAGAVPPVGIELLYSEPGETADAVIEKRVAAREAGSRVLVVTDDRVEQMTVEGFGAETMSAENFAKWIEREHRDLGRQLHAVRREARRYEKFP